MRFVDWFILLLIAYTLFTTGSVPWWGWMIFVIAIVEALLRGFIEGSKK